jgi:4-amino-4-deoxy-L-arabinose transferase-like glycosyltransferase
VSRTSPQKKGVRAALVVAALLVSALAIRVVFLVQLERSELSDALALDSRFYYDLGRSLSTGGSLGAGALDFNPLYPVFLAVVFRLFGEGILAPRIVQLAVGLITIALIYWAGTRLAEGSRRGKPSGRSTATIAAFMAIFYGQFMLHEGLILASTLEVFFLTAAFALALALDEDLREERPLKLGLRRIPPWASGLFLGALCGAGALGRPNLFLLVVAALPVWLVARNRRSRRGLIPAAGVLVGASLFLLPTIVHNAKATGEFVPVTAHGGINFYIGNTPGTTGVYRPPSNMRADMRGLLEDAKMIAEGETHRSMTGAEVSDFYVHAALDAIRSHPGGWLRLMGKKVLLFWNGTEVPSVPNNFFFEKSCGSLKVLFLPFAVISPLSMCGLIVFFMGRRNRSVVGVFLGCAFASVVLFFINTRYRLPAVPILILLAAFFIAWAAREISRRRFRFVVMLAAGALAFFFLVSNRTMVDVNHSAAYAFIGNYYMANNNEAKAAEAFAEAYRLDPDQIEAIINYARILRRQNQIQRSAGLYARAFAIMPNFPHLAMEYGSVIEILGRRADARRLYLHALAIGQAPEKALACRLLAHLAFVDGNREEALSWAKRALAITPNDARLAEMIKDLENAR